MDALKEVPKSEMTLKTVYSYNSYQIIPTVRTYYLIPLSRWYLRQSDQRLRTFKLGILVNKYTCKLLT